MKMNFLQLLGIILACALPSRVVRADVAPPVPVEIVAVPLALILVLCLVVLIIAVASFFIIRAIRRNQTPKGGV
jgi:hypothetical protein